MSEIADALENLTPFNNEDVDTLRAASARIRELEETVACEKRLAVAVATRLLVTGLVKQSSEFTVDAAVDVSDWALSIKSAAGDEDPIALIEAAKKSPKTRDGKQYACQMEVWFSDTDDTEDPVQGSMRGLVDWWNCDVVHVIDPVTFEGYTLRHCDCYSTREAAEAETNEVVE